MSLFVNPSGKIVMASNAKPIECFRCPCKNIVDDPGMYCVTENFYSGDGCTGSLLNTLPHKCMCMTPECTGDWDQEIVCQGRVQYVYESGPNVGCPDNCNPTPPPTCPTDCSTGYPATLNITFSGFTNSGECMGDGDCGIDGTFAISRTGCEWTGIHSGPYYFAQLICLGGVWTLNITGAAEAMVRATKTGSQVGSYTVTNCYYCCSTCGTIVIA